MHTLAFDGRTGASGDMILAALLDVGADPAVLAPVEDALDVEYVRDRTTTGGIDAATVEVVYAGADAQVGDRDDEDHQEHDHDHDAHDQGEVHSHDTHDHGDAHSHDTHDHGDAHSHDVHDHGDAHSHDTHDQGEVHSHDTHGHGDGPEHGPRAEGAGPTRTDAEVREIVEGMDLPGAVEESALAIFDRLGRAEAAVHGTDLGDTHFHEVGADDAIADVVGAALLLDDLDPDRIVTTPLATGGGEVEMSHGTAGVPAPAVAEIATEADWAIQGGPVDRELLTPTGAAILAEVAEGVESLPTMDVTGVGYGAGGYDLGERANALRVLRGETTGRLRREAITVLETNLDDASPEVLGSLQETLLAAGARDVSIVPVTMKKSRPGHLVKVIVDPADAERVARRLAEETGTLGVREHGAGHRWVADRETRTVEITIDGESYAVDVKVATDSAGEWLDASAEFDDAMSVARETGRPVRAVLRRAEAALEAGTRSDR